jgi:hypothetical protein
LGYDSLGLSATILEIQKQYTLRLTLLLVPFAYLSISLYSIVASLSVSLYIVPYRTESSVRLLESQNTLVVACFTGSPVS